MQNRPSRSDMDEVSEEAILEAELEKLGRSYRVMRNDYKTYKQETKQVVGKQRHMIDVLERERDELDIELASFRQAQDRTSQKIEVLEEEEEDYITAMREECDKHKALQKQVDELEDVTGVLRRKMAGRSNMDAVIAVGKRKRVLENRLDQSVVKFNSQLTVNRHLREEIEHLRREKIMFDNLYRRLVCKIESSRKEMKDIIFAATKAYDQRDDAYNKIGALKERNEKDQQLHDMEVKDLERIIAHDDKVREFMNIKNNERREYIEEEAAKKRKHGKEDKGVTAELDTIRMYEKAFAKIKEIKGETDVEKIVVDFIKCEDDNFALFNYVNELNYTLEQLKEEQIAVRNDISSFRLEEILRDEKHDKIMKELEGKYNKANKMAQVAEERLTLTNKTLDELKRGINNIFKQIQCDPTPLLDMLGGELNVNNKNIMIFMGQIEQRTTALLNLRQYARMKLAEIESTETQWEKPNIPSTLDIRLVMPSSVGDEFDDDDDDDRPLTEKQLRERALKKLARRAEAQNKGKKNLVVDNGKIPLSGKPSPTTVKPAANNQKQGTLAGLFAKFLK